MTPYTYPSPDWTTLVVEFWGCVPSPEREAAIALADTAIALAPFQIKEIVRLAFFAGGLDATEERWELFQFMWQTPTVTVEVDEVEVEVLPLLAGWIFTLAQAFVDGEVVRRPSQRCLQLDFYNLP